MNKKGFTLLELLAVIVVLSIIALIITPIVTGVISSSKDSANARSVEGHIKNVEYTILQKSFVAHAGNNKMYDGTKTEADLSFTYPSNDNVRCESYVIENGVVKVALKCKDTEWKDFFYYEEGKNASKTPVEGGGSGDGGGSSGEVTTKIENGTAIYFNPETATKCLESESVSTTGTKTGCMKWYAFNDEEGQNTVNLILDHNTTAKTKWETGSSNTTGPNTVEGTILYQLKQDTQTWTIPNRTDSYSFNAGFSNYTIDYSTYKARLITADEIAKIVTYNDWSSVDSNYTWFYLETKTTTGPSLSAGASLYKWLLDYTKNCTTVGCSVNDSSTEGYWTSSARVADGNRAWILNANGSLDYVQTDMTNYGLRPVITISKKLIAQ